MRRALAALLCLSMALPNALAPIAFAAGGKPKSRAATASRIVALARKELGKGVREVPDGSNRAPAIRRYETATRGAMYGAPWCAYFVSYIARRAGAPIGGGGSGIGYVPYIRSWAKQTKRWKATPRAGDLVTFPQHVGIVENVYANHTLTTIEGNSGNAVRRRWRKWGEAMGYVRVAKGAGAPVAVPKATPQKQAATPAPKKQPLAQKLVARITTYPGTTIAPGQEISFTSNDSSGDIVRSAWDFDGNGSYEASGDSLDHRFTKPGKVEVGLRVTDSAKKTATATVTVTVRTNRAPVAVLDVDDDVTVGDKITASGARSSDPDGKVVKYEWDLDGNGEWGEDGKRHTMTFDTPGDYSPGLRVTDDSGNVTETHVALHVADKPLPASRITCDSATVLAGRSVKCRADDSGSPVTVSDHSWDVDGDGTWDKRASSVTLSFGHAGTRTVRMRATDSRGRAVEDAVTITVTNNLPTASITGPSSVGLNATATFDGTRSGDVDGTLSRYEWDLDDDGEFETTGARPSVSFATPGRKTVRLRVTDDDGGTATAVTSVNVTNQAPRAVIALPASRRINTDLTFDGTGSSDPDGSVVLFEWDLDGDGSYETVGPRPVARYTATGRRTIRLRVTDAFGLTATTSTSITITT